MNSALWVPTAFTEIANTGVNHWNSPSYTTVAIVIATVDNSTQRLKGFTGKGPARLSVTPAENQKKRYSYVNNKF